MDPEEAQNGPRTDRSAGRSGSDCVRSDWARLGLEGAIAEGARQKGQREKVQRKKRQFASYLPLRCPSLAPSLPLPGSFLAPSFLLLSQRVKEGAKIEGAKIEGAEKKEHRKKEQFAPSLPLLCSFFSPSLPLLCSFFAPSLPLIWSFFGPSLPLGQKGVKIEGAEVEEAKIHVEWAKKGHPGSILGRSYACPPNGPFEVHSGYIRGPSWVHLGAFLPQFGPDCPLWGLPAQEFWAGL